MKVVEYNRNVGKRFLLYIIYISNTRVTYIYIFLFANGKDLFPYLKVLLDVRGLEQQN